MGCYKVPLVSSTLHSLPLSHPTPHPSQLLPNFCSTGGDVAPIILPLSREGGPGAGRLPDDQNQRSERIADFGDNGLWSEDADMEALGLALDSNEVEPEDAPLVGSPRLNSPRQNNAARRPGDGSPPARQPLTF